MQGAVNTAKVKELMKVNAMVRAMKADKDLEIVFKKIKLDDIMFVTFVDAAWNVLPAVGLNCRKGFLTYVKNASVVNKKCTPEPQRLPK